MRPPIVVLNPLLDALQQTRRQRLTIAGLRRADLVVMFSRSGIPAALELGVSPEKLTFVPLGTRARRDEPVPPGDYLLAAGREQRDWATLAEAANGIDTEIRVMGPTPREVSRPLRLMPQRDRRGFLAALEDARALVVPLRPTGRSLGQLTVLDAMSVGRATVATHSPGTVDYVSDATGSLVPPQDPEALRDALVEMLRPGVAESKGGAALTAAQGPFALHRFVRRVDDLAKGLGR
jgi:glycosyltransferase involved in cell wall biosynthesis